MPARKPSPKHKYPPGSFDLQKKVFSWSAYNVWTTKGKTEFYEKYIMRGADYLNPRMMAGRIVDDAFSKDEPVDDKMLQHLRTFAPQYDYTQFELTVPFNGLTLVMHLDGLTIFHDKPGMIIGETKTGSMNPASCWTQKKADEWEQLSWYVLGAHLDTGEKPEDIRCVLTWVPMHWGMGEAMPRPTGEMINFETRRTTMDTINIGKKILTAWNEIEAFSRKELEAIGL